MSNRAEFPSVSVVIPTLNEERYLPFLLESLTQVGPVDVIVVDGGSDDDTTGVVSRFQPRFTDGASLRLISNHPRIIAAQRNAGARAARHHILLFLDADVVIPSREVFERLLREFLDRGYAAANPRFVQHPLDTHFFGLWGYHLIYAIQRFLLWRGKPIFTGACILTHRSAFEEVGGFDETLLLSEDAEFTRRICRAGTCGILSVRVANSTRRMKKIRGAEAIALLKVIPGLYVHGRVSNALIAHYGFGDHDTS